MGVRLAHKTQLGTQPQLVLCSRLLQSSVHELEQLLLVELAANPALEAEVGGRPGTRAAGFASQDVEQMLERIAAPVTPLAQIENLLTIFGTGAARDAALRLLGYLDAHGYLREHRAYLLKELGLDAASLDGALDLLRQVGPPGIGAQDLRECLLLQTNYLRERQVDCTLAQQILQDCWAELTEQRWARIARVLDVSPEAVLAAVTFIRQRLHPYPLDLLPEAGIAAPLHHPDLVIHHARDQVQRYALELPGETVFSLRLCPTFTALSQAGTGDLSPDEAQWVETYVQRAKLFLYAWQQRWETLRRLGEHLIQRQNDFLQRGPRFLKPITRAALAEALGIHPSTVGRAVRDKVVQLPDGELVLLSDFFDGSLPAKATMRRILTCSGNALSDREIVQQLRREGIVLARRTVNKYRREMAIPSSYLR